MEFFKGYYEEKGSCQLRILHVSAVAQCCIVPSGCSAWKTEVLSMLKYYCNHVPKRAQLDRR